MSWFSVSFLVLLCVLGLALHHRPGGWKRLDSASLSRRIEENSSWKSELEKEYPFVVGEVPVMEWDYEEEAFCEKVCVCACILACLTYLGLGRKLTVVVCIGFA